MKKIVGFLFLFISFHSSAQKIYGIVFNDKGDLLPYSSVTIKGTSIGASANNHAKFLINLSPGTYTVVCQHIGYATQEKKITIGTEDEEVPFVLKEQQLTMKAVVIKSNSEDPAYAIIRQAIKKHFYYNNQVKSFQCNFYSKDMIKLRSLPDKFLGKKIPESDKTEMGVDSSGKGIIYLSESISKIASTQPDKFKMEVTSSRVSGSGGFGFTFPAFISFYQNNVTIFQDELNPRGFVSPIADGALGFYKYKYLGSFWEDGKEINSIRVTPKRSYEPLFSGIINITDGDWRIHSVDLILTKKSQLEILDTLQITQFHVPVGNDVWRVKNQLLYFDFNQLGIDAVGNFVNVYSDYNIDPKFPKKFFDNVIIKYDTGVNKKPRAYWDSARPVPLEREEVLDYKVKDSLYEIHKEDTVLTQHQVDSLKKKQGPLKLYQVLWSNIDRTKYSINHNFNWGIHSLISGLQYNPAEGIVLETGSYFNEVLKQSKTNLSIEPNVRYGFNNTHLNAWLNINFKTRDWENGKKLKRETVRISGGKRVSQFNKENPVSPFNNSISTLFWGDDYMKTYENYFGNINYSRRFEDGLRLGIAALYEDRMPLNNTSGFTFFKKDSSSLTPNYPYQRIPAQFTPHKAFIISLDLSFKPGQKYIQLPDRKIPLGSKYPTFSFNYTKGFKNIFGSNVDFDKWRFTINDNVNFKLAGLLKYKIAIGGFLNSNAVYIQDYQHFNANRSLVAGEYVSSFQLASYYANSTDNNFYSFANIEHHFNGLLTNKIPVIKKWDWNLVAGTNAFYVNNTNNYIEVFLGFENILKIFRVDYIVAYENGKQTIRGFCIGTGGLIGDHIDLNAPSKNSGFHF
jgi:hypothetical protein